jgi:predicted GTPase
MTTNLDSDLIGLINEKLNEALRKRGKVNILIAGKTGVGKSTLINAVFQGELATTGQGRPVTQQTREIKKDGIPVSVFDTRGLELEKFQETLLELSNFIDEQSKREDPNEHIHCAWVCIAEDSRRIEDAEINLCKSLASRMPVVVIITKARSDKGFRSEVQSIIPDVKNVVRIRAIQPELRS